MLSLLLQGAASPPGELQNGRKPPKDKMHKSRKRKSCDAEDDPPGAAPAALVNGLVQGMATGAAASAAAVLPLTGSTAACLRLVQDFGTQLQVMTADTTYGCLLSQEGCPLPRLAQWQGACAPLHAVQLGSGAGDVAVLAAGEAVFASLQVRACGCLITLLSCGLGRWLPDHIAQLWSGEQGKADSGQHGADRPPALRLLQPHEAVRKSPARHGQVVGADPWQLVCKSCRKPCGSPLKCLHNWELIGLSGKLESVKS